MVPLERGPLQPETLGLERTRAKRQTTEFIDPKRPCPCCGRPRACKGRQSIVYHMSFGKLQLASPRLYRCRGESTARESFSPSVRCLPERTSPELAYLETKFAALVSYGLTLKLLKDVLPIGQHLNVTAL